MIDIPKGKEDKGKVIITKSAWFKLLRQIADANVKLKEKAQQEEQYVYNNR